MAAKHVDIHGIQRYEITRNTGEKDDDDKRDEKATSTSRTRKSGGACRT